jgi:hypothetical protein
VQDFLNTEAKLRQSLVVMVMSWGRRALGGNNVSFRREREFNGVSFLIHSTVQILAGLPAFDVGL